MKIQIFLYFLLFVTFIGCTASTTENQEVENNIPPIKLNPNENNRINYLNLGIINSIRNWYFRCRGHIENHGISYPYSIFVLAFIILISCSLFKFTFIRLFGDGKKVYAIYIYIYIYNIEWRRVSCPRLCRFFRNYKKIKQNAN